MNIKINKQNIKLPRYFRNSKRVDLVANMDSYAYWTRLEDKQLKKIQASKFIFDSIRPIECIGEIKNYLTIDSVYELYACQHQFSVHTAWRFKLLKPIYHGNQAFKYLYIALT